MMRKLLFILLINGIAWGQVQLSPSVRNYVSVEAPIVVLTHVRLIDGTGAPPRDDQSITIASGKIQSVTSASATPAADAKVRDLHGYSVIPGLVGMHEHMF